MGVPGRAASCAGKVFGLISTELENKTHSVPRAHAEGPGGVGPVSPDTVFRQCLKGRYDLPLAKYGDQGHIAIRTAGFFETSRWSSGCPTSTPRWRTGRPMTSWGVACTELVPGKNFIWTSGVFL
ncbi:TPA: 4-hydroxythreonine-4-phosphate dehydrogenase PdxA [Burkholderia vietnamiensis]|nr:4-hydroxythreonine-4-phosphate dehydrogenase PdxA [Burkholderia vietnamiensis]